MPIIGEKEQAQIREMLQDMSGPVNMMVFVKAGCQPCAQLQDLSTELAALSDQLSATVVDIEADPGRAAEYGIDKAPALALVGQQDHGVCFYGLPTGYEFGALIEGLVDVAKGSATLGKKSQEYLGQITAPVRIQVFTTPICPVCPNMVRLAHRLAIESGLVRAEGVDATEFMELAEKYQVQSVPRTIVNETLIFDGMIPEGRFLMEIVKAAAQAARS